MEAKAPPKHQIAFNGLSGAISQKIEPFRRTAVAYNIHVDKCVETKNGKLFPISIHNIDVMLISETQFTDKKAI
jgi:hypothetical protein